MGQLEASQQRSHEWRLRDRVFVVLTANIAVICFWATQHVSQEYVLTPNSARLLLMMFTPSAVGPATVAAEPGQQSPSASSHAALQNPLQARKRLEAQIAAVEVIVYVWRRVMWAVAGFLELAALLAAITGRSRLLHLLAAGLIVLSTAATLVAMHLLIDPDYGGMEPLAIRAHVYVAAAQSAYGVVLLIAFARRPQAVTAQPD